MKRWVPIVALLLMSTVTPADTARELGWEDLLPAAASF